MTYDPVKHKRRSIRLKGYNYAQSGWYFVTICTQKRAPLLGDIVNGKMVLNDIGKMVNTIWIEIPQYYPGIKYDFYQIMPNHFHGIINIVGTDPRVCPENEQPGTGQSSTNTGQSSTNTGQSQGIAPTVSLPIVVQRFKSLTTKRYIDGVSKYGWRPFHGKIWQRNYYACPCANRETHHLR